MIEKLPSDRYVTEGDVVAKLNELIDAYNNHFHHARELQYGTGEPRHLGGPLLHKGGS
jgi:hypothetical protein